MTDDFVSDLPIIPLHAVLFPGGPLPLRIFEPRYLDMISSCMKDDRPFGISLISDGDEVGAIASFHSVGTIARIEDWHMGNDGILGITVIGERRFQIDSSRILENHLAMANVNLLVEEDASSIPSEYEELSVLLRDTMSRYKEKYSSREHHFDSASWVGNRLAELLPLKLAQRQYFLQLTDPVQRLERISAVLDHIDLTA